MAPKRSVSASQAPAQHASTLPTVFRFPIAVVIDLSLSALLYTLASTFIANDLATVAKEQTEWWEVGTLIAVRVTVLAAAWWNDYDGYDISALSVLTRFPLLYLLFSFHGVQPSTMITSLVIDAVALYVPFTLLRPITAAHTSDAPKGSVANRTVINDRATQVLVTALSAGAFALVYSLASKARLWFYLAMYMNVKDTTAAWQQQFIQGFFHFIIVGFATKVFVFTPSVAARPDERDAKKRDFDPVSATLWETVSYNLWGWSAHQRVLYERTLVLALAIFVNTFTQSYSTVQGVEVFGATYWAGIWTVGAIFSGGLIAWVTQIEEVQE